MWFVIRRGQVGREWGGVSLSDDSDKVLLVWVPQAISNMSAPLPWRFLPRKRADHEGLSVGTMFLQGERHPQTSQASEPGGCPGANCPETQQTNLAVQI